MNREREKYTEKRARASRGWRDFDEFLVSALGITVTPTENRIAYAANVRNNETLRMDPNIYRPEFVDLVRSIKSVLYKPLGEIVSFSEQRRNPVSTNAETFRYIEISGVDRATGFVTANEIPVGEAPSRARMVVRKGDIIVSLTRPHHGSIALIGEEHDDCIASTGFAVVRELKEGSPSPVCLLALLRSSLCLRQMLQRSGGGGYPAIVEEELKRVLIPIPGASVQRRIEEQYEMRTQGAIRLMNEARHDWKAAQAWMEDVVSRVIDT